MCGICGAVDYRNKSRVPKPVIHKMAERITHRGPDCIDSYVNGDIGLGFTRLSIIDIEGGMQPIFNEDKSIVIVCNGEIFNFIELRDELEKKGHHFRTKSDVEVVLHLYEDHGTDFINRLNGQFAFAIYDFNKQELFCARDHFGIAPFYYTRVDGQFIFASEIKSILEYPGVEKAVNLVGLDQTFAFPGMISPVTAFKGIHSLEAGHYIVVKGDCEITNTEYWDLVYPTESQAPEAKSEGYYIDKLDDLITKAVDLRLRSDVPVGFYISGGLDSSLVAMKIFNLTPDVRRYSFSIDFTDREISEARYQKIIADKVQSIHTSKLFLFSDILNRLPKVISHCECPLKESYNTASLALSEAVREKDIKVVLSGEGADEWFAGYVGYRFDKIRQMQGRTSANSAEEAAIREKLWGDPDFFYEKDQYAFSKTRKDIYSKEVNGIFEDIDCLNHFVVDKSKLKDRDVLHKRSYLDYKLRIADHLVADHGDRMSFGNSVEVRYPFLDKDLVEFIRTIPPDLKLKDFEEKYILKEAARKEVPEEIIDREKFSFVAPGSSYLIKRDTEYLNDILSYERIKRQGIFNPDRIEALKKEYTKDDFSLNVPFDSDLLMIALTFGILVDEFKINL